MKRDLIEVMYVYMMTTSEYRTLTSKKIHLVEFIYLVCWFYLHKKYVFYLMAVAKSGLSVARQDVLATFNCLILGTPNILFSYIMFLIRMIVNDVNHFIHMFSPICGSNRTGFSCKLISAWTSKVGFPPSLVVKFLPIKSFQQIFFSKVPKVSAGFDFYLVLKKSF